MIFIGALIFLTVSKLIVWQIMAGKALRHYYFEAEAKVALWGCP